MGSLEIVHNFAESLERVNHLRERCMYGKFFCKWDLKRAASVSDRIENHFEFRSEVSFFVSGVHLLMFDVVWTVYHLAILHM